MGRYDYSLFVLETSSSEDPGLLPVVVRRASVLTLGWGGGGKAVGVGEGWGRVDVHRGPHRTQGVLFEGWDWSLTGSLTRTPTVLRLTRNHFLLGGD